MIGLLVGLVVHLFSHRHEAPPPAHEMPAAPPPTRQWREFLDISSDWVWEIDAEHRFVDIPGAPLLPASTSAALTGKSWEEVVVSELPADLVQAHRDALERRGPLSVTLGRPGPDGETRFLELRGRPVFDAAGRFMGYRGIARDVSERERFKQELRRSEERLHALLAQSADAYWEQDANLRYSAITPCRGELSALALDDAPGKRRWEAAGINEDEPHWAAHIAQIRQLAPFSNFRYLRANGAGREVWLLESGVPVYDARGLFTGYCGIVRDVSAEQDRYDALAANERRYRESFMAAPVGIAHLSVDERWLRVNPALLELLGYAEKDLAGQPLEALMDIDELAAARSLRARALAGEAPPFTREARYRQASGDALCCRETLALVREEAQAPYFIVLVEDISAVRREIEKLRSGEARYRQLFESAPEALLVCADGRIRLANAAARRMIGDGESLDGVRMLDLVHPDDQSMESERIEHFAADRQQLALPPLPVRYRRQDGKPLRIEASGVRILFEGRDALHYVLRDVARWQSAEQVLQESRARYRDVVESMNEILFQTDSAYRLNFLNRAWHQITGFDGRLSLDQNLLDFVVAEDRMPVERQLQAIREGFHDNVRFEFRLRTQTAGPCWVEATVRPLRDSQDQTVGTSGTLDDITDRKNAEQSQRNLNTELETRVRVRTAQLEASNRELEAFSYSVSHDLRAPLRAIDGFAQIVSEDYEPRLDQTGKEYLQRIRVATQRMAALIDDLIDLARLTRQTMKREQVDLSRLAETIFADLRQEEPQRQVEVHIEPNLFAAADRALIRVALDNLLRNAWKFTSRNGLAQIRFHAEQRDRQTIYCVSDNGAGFDMCFASKLFLPFHRLHGINEFAGTGIGLATVQRVIHRHEGKIWAESYPEKGASFFFTLCH